MEIEEKKEEAKWYALRTYSNYENVAKTNLEDVKVKYGLTDRIFDIVIPMEDVIEEKKGKKVLVQKKLMQAYIFVKMIYSDSIWHHVTRTKGICSFVGPNGRALSLTDDEVARLRLERIVTNLDNLNLNDKVEIINGALQSMTGTIVSLNGDTQKAKITVEMFGRETQVELDYCDFRKIDI